MSDASLEFWNRHWWDSFIHFQVAREIKTCLEYQKQIQSKAGFSRTQNNSSSRCAEKESSNWLIFHRKIEQPNLLMKSFIEELYSENFQKNLWDSHWEQNLLIVICIWQGKYFETFWSFEMFSRVPII